MLRQQRLRAHPASVVRPFDRQTATIAKGRIARLPLDDRSKQGTMPAEETADAHGVEDILEATPWESPERMNFSQIMRRNGASERTPPDRPGSYSACIRERLASWPSAGEWTLGRHTGLAVTQARSARAPRRRIFFVNARCLGVVTFYTPTD